LPLKVTSHQSRKKRYIIAASIAITAISIALYNAAQSNPYKYFFVWNFDSPKNNNLYGNVVPILNTGSNEGIWLLKQDVSSPSKPNVLAKLASNYSKTGYSIITMPNQIFAKELKASVKFKIIPNDSTQKSVGLIVRLEDKSHYFVLAADAKNSLFSLCRAEPERLICTQDVNTNITTDKWHNITAQVSAQGIAGYLDNTLLIQRYDQHYINGQIGLWTKGDSTVYFDDLRIDY
jgi:hypothetical protein